VFYKNKTDVGWFLPFNISVSRGDIDIAVFDKNADKKLRRLSLITHFRKKCHMAAFCLTRSSCRL
jgi:hypothetical protein